MSELKPSDFPAGTWFVVPLPDEAHFAVGLIVAQLPQKLVEAVFFGPYDRPPTLDDVAGLAAGDAVQIFPDITNYQIRSRRILDGTFALLGPHDGLGAEGWFEPLDFLTTGINGVQYDLANVLVPEWQTVTDPVMLSSWFCVEAGRSWLDGFAREYGIEFLDGWFRNHAERAAASATASQYGFVAVEMAARAVTAGRMDHELMGELPEIDHGPDPKAVEQASKWAREIPPRQRGNRELMMKLAGDAEQTLDLLLDQSVWVAELRSAEPAVWEAFSTRVDAVRAWLGAGWIAPTSSAGAGTGITDRFDDDDDDDYDDFDDDDDAAFTPRPIPDGVDPLVRLAEMSWFDFDAVSDWTAGPLLDIGVNAVRAALDAAHADGSGDSYVGAIGLAAADVIARLASADQVADFTGGPVERRVRDWVSAMRGVPVEPGDLEQARQVVELVRLGEMAEDIDTLDDESRASWAHLLHSIERRLDPPC